MILLVGCASTNHYLIHPRKAAPEVIVWSADFARDELKVHIEGARPPGAGPFPTVLVLPEEEQTASDMHGVIWDLAARGYVAIAADYQRRIEGKYRRSMFAWRSSGDLTLILDVTRAYPEVDQNRIGALGFSEGAVVSLLMAAHDPDRIKAVVAYYPITDFPHWYAGKRSGLCRHARSSPWRAGSCGTNPSLPTTMISKRSSPGIALVHGRVSSAPPFCSCTEHRIRCCPRRNRSVWPSV